MTDTMDIAGLFPVANKEDTAYILDRDASAANFARDLWKYGVRRDTARQALQYIKDNPNGIVFMYAGETKKDRGFMIPQTLGETKENAELFSEARRIGLDIHEGRIPKSIMDACASAGLSAEAMSAYTLISMVEGGRQFLLRSQKAASGRVEVDLSSDEGVPALMATPALALEVLRAARPGRFDKDQNVFLFTCEGGKKNFRVTNIIAMAIIYTETDGFAFKPTGNEAESFTVD